VKVGPQKLKVKNSKDLKDLATKDPSIF